ncbi:hypothetical protein PFTANZ_03804 [Plasmodium falciparum Tanzania (2000708)]|uniref:Uncharacterized protein n=1 Tax=Plasmodium falciparum Tanzania (2000708) TaxID=1036725 RepID=A0A024W4Q7_PLAFA|nr:hypothetical protein PFTANZ_03804 [Plasmodium falciparum Tanzania (2000708)]
MNYNKISLYIIIFCFSLSFFHTFIVIKKFNIYSKQLFPQTYNTYTHNISKKKKKKCTYNINYYYCSSLPYLEDFNIARDKKSAFAIYMNHKNDQINEQINNDVSNITNVDHIRENQDHNIFTDCNKMIEPKKKKKKM